jgi:tRNA-specific adenosine deaminase 3
MKRKTCEQKPLPCDGHFAWHPLKHAPMVAIENAAKRDGTMFPSLTTITKPYSNGNLEKYCDNEPAKRLNTYIKVSLVDYHNFSLKLLI